MFQARPQQRCQGRQVDGQPLARVSIFDGAAKQCAIFTHPEVDHQREIATGRQRAGVGDFFTQVVSPFLAWQTRAVSSSLVVLTLHIHILACPA